MKTWLALAVASMIASGSARAQQEEPPGATDFRAGQEAAKKKDWDAAIPALEKALKANPSLFGGHYLLGFAYQAKQNWVKCGENFEQFLQKLGSQEAPTERAYATRSGGLCFVRAENYARAIPLLQKAAAAKPNDDDVQSALGIALMRANREAEAEQTLSKVIQLKPNTPNPYYYAGRINFYQKELEKAHTRLTKYLELDPNGTFAADAHFLLGSVIYQQAEQTENKSEAFAMVRDHMSKFIEARPTAPQAPDALYILGYVSAHLEDNEAAKGYFERFLKLRPDGPQADEAKRFLAEMKESAQ